ncbi:MAG: hypothetical protein EWM72_02942 [Nitrospira sp.]|nr:MAG: hypothetical protein EWM72_02942 [Nitrospira sp.]
MRIEFFDTHISNQAVTRVADVLRSTRLSEGKMVKDFETELSRQIGLRNPVALNSGTSALHLGLALSGVGPGDEVILPAQTFIATGLVILAQYAKPVFADIQLRTGNIDPESIRRKITERTKAIMPVHWAGYPCDMDEIHAIAKEFNLAIIEDAAHALGATYKGRRVGTISRFTAFSFQAIKHLTTGDGGALCCLLDDDHRRARSRRWFGIDREHSQVSVLGERDYNVREVGYKYHMNDLSAAVGLGNLGEFDVTLKRRQDIADLYRTQLRGVPGLRFLECRDDRRSACWLFTVLVENRLAFIKKLKAQGIPASVVHQRIDRNLVFGGKTPGLDQQTIFDDRQISIPLHSKLTDEDVDHIIRAIHQGW